MKLIRRSEVVDFLRCRKAWDYRWNQNLEPARPDGKLFFGNLFHKFIETYYNNNCDPVEASLAMIKLFEETDTSRMEQTAIDELLDLASKVTSNYVQQWHHIDRTWNVIATELTFAIPLDGELYYTGTIDVIFKDQNGKLFFMDHKTASSIQRYVDKVELDTQISCYWWALEQLARGNGMIWAEPVDGDPHWVDVKDVDWSRPGKWHEKQALVEPSGFIYNIILKDFPHPPEPLKKGGLSKAKNQKTTYQLYRDTLIELRKNDLERKPESMVVLSDGYMIPEEYKEILDHLKAQETEHGNRFFRRVPVTRSEHQVQTAMHELLATAMDIDKVKTDKYYHEKTGEDYDPIYRNPTHDCSWCNFRSLCVAEFDGVNAELIKSTLYVQKELQLNEPVTEDSD